MLEHFISEDQGFREYMEDRWSYSRLKNGHHLYCIFDGHGGDKVAEFCKNNFADILTQFLLNEPSDISICIRKAIKSLDDLVKLLNVPQTGSTLVMCLITPDRIWFANVGDSLAMTCSHFNTLSMMSVEHKAESEADRIRAAGGIVTYWDGIGRVNATLNLSRSIGDHYLRESGVIAEPHIRSINKNRDDIDYIFIASDGIWDVYNMLQINIDLRKLFYKHRSYKEAIDNIITQAKIKGSRDNITICLIKVR